MFVYQVADSEIGEAYGKAVLPDAKMGDLKREHELISSQHEVGDQQERKITYVAHTSPA
jgi:hypothetical protein